MAPDSLTQTQEVTTHEESRSPGSRSSRQSGTPGIRQCHVMSTGPGNIETPQELRRTVTRQNSAIIENENAQISTDMRNDSDLEGQKQPHLPRVATTFIDRTITDWWWWELLSCFMSLSCMAAIVAILLVYDGKRRPEFIIPGITLNAYVAIFAAIAKAAMILPVSEAIGQLKWIWFRKESNIWDFHTFDSASRGPWGSLMLIGTTKCRHLVSIGAGITVLALAFEPFFQQIVSFPTRSIPKGTAKISIAKSYNYISDLNYVVGNGFDAINLRGGPRGMSVAVGDAISSRNESVRSTTSVCPTGRCDWPSYSTLGVCHKCQDVSQLLEYICDPKVTMPLPDSAQLVQGPCGFQMKGYFIVGAQNGSGDYSLAGQPAESGPDRRGKFWNSTAFIGATNPILDFYLAFIPGGRYDTERNSSAVLLECLFHWCAKTFRASFQEGVLQEKLICTQAEQTLLPEYNVSGTLPFAIETGDQRFDIPEGVTFGLQRAILSFFPSWIINYTVDSTGKFPGGWDFIRTPPYDINPLLTKIGEAMTNNMRSRDVDTELVNGTAWVTETFVKIRWP